MAQKQITRVGFRVFEVLIEHLICLSRVSPAGSFRSPLCSPASTSPRFFFLKTASMSTEKEKSEAPALSNSASEDSESNAKQDKAKTESRSDSASKIPIRYATRGKILTEQQKNVQVAIDKITSLDITKKRKLYKCKERYTELKNIPTWPENFSELQANEPNKYKKWWKIHQKELVLDVKPDLNAKISIFLGDITSLEIDAIANAANESLLGGGGVDGAIHTAAGKDLLNECELLNGCKAGEARITCGYKLPAKNVIHTVGPRGERPEVLQNCYMNSLDLVRDNELKSVAFPCISTGIFGYPNLNAAKVALKTIRHWLDNEEYAEKIERIIFCLFLEKDVDIYNEQLQLFFPVEREDS